MEKNGNKVWIKFSDYFKLQLHDPSSYWSSKSVHAIILPGLCASVILGLPFLTHNHIVIDAATHTAIHKQCRFDLLHPTLLPAFLLPKQKLKGFYNELQEDCKLIIAELKMACQDHLIHTCGKFGEVEPEDLTAAVQQQIEVLAPEQRLQAC